LKLTTAGHKASRGLSATAELLVWKDTQQAWNRVTFCDPATQ